jgi:hypothetical protein
LRAFKLPNDPKFAEKLKDLVGLYVDPPAHAVVLSIDEKSQIQALDRTQPGLPMRKGRCATMTYDYKRNGTTLFAALDILEGKVIGAAPPASGIHPHSQCRRGTRCRPTKRSTWFSTTTPPTSTQSHGLAEAAPTLHLPLHPNFLLLGQCARRLVCQAHPATAQAQRVHLNCRAQIAINRFIADASGKRKPFLWTNPPTPSSPLSSAGDKG